MLSTTPHQYAPGFDTTSAEANIIPRNGHAASQRISTSGLDTLAQGSQYALKQLQQTSMAGRHSTSALKSPIRSRHHPYDDGSNDTAHGSQKSLELDSREDGKSGTAGPVRRRISRACDQCNQLRTKCDGKNPCAHCVGKCHLRLGVHRTELTSCKNLALRVSTSGSARSVERRLAKTLHSKKWQELLLGVPCPQMAIHRKDHRRHVRTKTRTTKAKSNHQSLNYRLLPFRPPDLPACSAVRSTVQA